MHLWCFLFFCFLISRINKLHFLDTGCENAKLWFQFKGCVTASRHNSAARIRTLASLFSYFDVRKTVIMFSTHSRPPRRLCCGDQSPWCGCRRGGPAARTGRTRTAHWSSSASHRNHLKYVKYLKKFNKSLLLTAGQLELADVGVERVAGELHVAADHRHVAPGQGTD